MPQGIRWTGGRVEINGSEVIRELSNYLDESVGAELRQQIAAHLASCSHCTAIWDGLRNTVILMADERWFELPAGFSERLRARLAFVAGEPELDVRLN